MKEFQNEPINASVVAHPMPRKEPDNMVFSVSLSRIASDDILPSMTITAPDTDYETWRGEMAAVQVEIDRVKVLNAPTVALNRAITKSNIMQPGLKEALLPMPFHAEEWTRPFTLREEQHSARIARKSPLSWKRDVESIADKILRAAVASIVWWDFFGSRPVLERWPHLDKYLDAVYVPVAKEDLKRGLAMAGYSPWHAERRLSASLEYSMDQPQKKRCKVNNVFHNVAKNNK